MKNLNKIVEEAVRIYFEQNCSAKEAVEKAKEMYRGRSDDK